MRVYVRYDIQSRGSGWPACGPCRPAPDGRAIEASANSAVRRVLPPASYAGSVGGMKVSVSVPGEDVRFLDDYAKEQGLDSRSVVVHEAVRLLRSAELGAAYESAWEQWATHGDAEAWDSTVGDGLLDGVPS